MLRAGVLGLVSLALFLLGLLAMPARAQEAAPPAEPPKTQSLTQSLNEILKGVDTSNIRVPARTAADPVAETKIRQSVTAADLVRRQLISKGCWGDQDELSSGRQLRAVVEIRFGADGKLVQRPALIEPATMPANDLPLQVFISRAVSAIEKCDARGFQLPPEFLAAQPIPIIELDFRP